MTLDHFYITRFMGYIDISMLICKNDRVLMQVAFVHRTRVPPTLTGLGRVFSCRVNKRLEFGDCPIFRVAKM
jgi:hypothetical protein